MTFINRYLSSGSAAYLTLYALLIIFFAFFYTSITFDTEGICRQHEALRWLYPGYPRGASPPPTTSGMYPTASRGLVRSYLAVVALVPTIMFSRMGIMGGSFGGTSIMILVGVGLQTVKDIDAQLQQRHYDGFLR